MNGLLFCSFCLLHCSDSVAIGIVQAFCTFSLLRDFLKLADILFFSSHPKLRKNVCKCTLVSPRWFIYLPYVVTWQVIAVLRNSSEAQHATLQIFPTLSVFNDYDCKRHLEVISLLVNVEQNYGACFSSLELFWHVLWGQIVFILEDGDFALQS